jgi:hypothetical protein
VSTGPVAIGDEQFLRKLSGDVNQIPEGAEQITITSDADGNIIGDTSHIDPHILAQLQTPQAREQIRDMHESWKNGGGKLPGQHRHPKEPKREPRYLNEGTRRDFTHLRPAGMDAKTFKTLRKQQFRKMRKAALKMQRSLHNG